MTINAVEVARLLGGERALRRRVRNVDDLRQVVEAGLPVAALDRVVFHLAGASAEAAELKHQIVPRTTLQRRRGRLSSEESQRLERLARMVALAEFVWEDKELAHEFLTSGQPQLGGERPVELTRSDLGTRQVETLLIGLEYSLPV